MSSRNAPSGCVAPSPATAAPPSPTNLRLTVGQSGSESANEPGGDLEERILQDGYWEYGRFYGSWKKGKYNFPIDKEETSRLDILHKYFIVELEDRVTSVPLDKEGSPKIMDLGTGTGIWAFHVVEGYIPNAQIMAVDLNQIQPALIPRGVTTKQFDLEEPSWEPLLRDCDLIHIRLLYGSIRDDLWADTYRKIFEHLAPGGYIEHLEIDWTPQWDGEDRPTHSAIREWSQQFHRAMHRYRRSVKVSTEDTKRMMEAAGFTEFKETTIRCYLNPWSTDRHQREAARWFNLALGLGLEAMSLMPMIDMLHMKQEDVVDLCKRVKAETCVLRYHTYFTLHTWTAKKPASPPQ
nr:chromatin methyl transferase [Trichoderma gamsii]